jgi:hypothetical protein
VPSQNKAETEKQAQSQPSNKNGFEGGKRRKKLTKSKVNQQIKRTFGETATATRRDDESRQETNK